MRHLTYENIPEVSFMDLLRALNHCQTIDLSGLLHEEDVREALRLSDHFYKISDNIRVTVFGVYSGPEMKWNRRCSRIELSRFKGPLSGAEHYTGLVSRITAPVSPYFHGPRYVVTLKKPNFKIMTLPPQYVGPSRDLDSDPDGETYLVKSLQLT